MITLIASQLPTGGDITSVGTAEYTIGGVMMLFIIYLAWRDHVRSAEQKKERDERNNDAKETRDLLIDLVTKNTETTQANMATIASLKELINAKRL